LFKFADSKVLKECRVELENTMTGLKLFGKLASLFLNLSAIAIRLVGKWIRRIVVVGIIVGLVGLNIASLTVTGVYDVLSDTIENVGQRVSGKKTRTVRLQRASEYDKIKIINRQQATRITGLEDNVTRLTSTNGRLKIRMHEFSSTFDSASKKIASRSRKGALRNISSMALEGIPSVGVVVIASVTAMEVYDACATMQDLENLRSDYGLSEVDEQNGRELCGFDVPFVFNLGGSKDACEDRISDLEESWDPLNGIDFPKIECPIISPKEPKEIIGTEIQTQNPQAGEPIDAINPDITEPLSTSKP
jgi:hypothetical protein